MAQGEEGEAGEAGRAGGNAEAGVFCLLRPSTRRALCFDEPSPRFCTSIDPKGKSSGHV